MRRMTDAEADPEDRSYYSIKCPGCGDVLPGDDCMRGAGGRLYCPECVEQPGKM